MHLENVTFNQGSSSHSLQKIAFYNQNAVKHFSICMKMLEEEGFESHILTYKMLIA